MSDITLDRIRLYVAKLDDPRTGISQRFEYWRGIISAGHTGHEGEAQRMDSLNSLKADPSTEVSVA